MPPRDHLALADRLAQLHANAWLAQGMGRAGMRRVRALFTWERVTADLVDVYESLTERRQPVPVSEPVVQPATARRGATRHFGLHA